MLFAMVAYRNPGDRKTPSVASLKESIPTAARRSILSEYIKAADACQDEARAALIRFEARHVPIAAGLPSDKEAGNA